MVNRKRSISGAAQKFLSFNKDEEGTPEVINKDEEVVVQPTEVKKQEIPDVKESDMAKAEKIEIVETKVEPVKEEVGKEEKSVKVEQLVGYTFKITKTMRKRMNRVIDEMDDNGEKISKQDFILQAVEKEIARYEKKYDL